MARALRIEFEGALYHVMARGNARADIFLCDADRQAFIDNLTGGNASGSGKALRESLGVYQRPNKNRGMVHENQD